MSSMLSFIVLGPVYFIGPMNNIQPNVSSSVNSTFVPNTDPTESTSKSLNVIKRDDYTYTPGIGGHKIYTQAEDWNTARRACEKDGAHLAIVNSIAESRVIVELMARSPPHVNSYHSSYAIVGFHGFYSDTDYITIHGESLAEAGYSMWDHGEPTHNGEKCGTIRNNGGFNDVLCSWRFAFICELPFPNS